MPHWPPFGPPSPPPGWGSPPPGCWPPGPPPPGCMPPGPPPPGCMPPGPPPPPGCRRPGPPPPGCMPPGPPPPPGCRRPGWPKKPPGPGNATPQRKMLVFPSKNELSQAMAEYAANLSAKFCKEKGHFTVVLSGGGLINWLCYLLKPPYINSIEWSKWHIFWVDERVCSHKDPDSNYKLAMDGFLSKVPIPSKNIYAINENKAKNGDAEHCAKLYEDCLKGLVNQNIIPICSKTGFPQFDLQLLGMGPDGHMASLFPGHDQINEKNKWVTHIIDSPKPPPKRITFTLPVINSALYNLMAVCDDPDPRTPVTIAKIMKHNDLSLPSAHLSAQVENVWYLDQTVASLL